VKRPLLAALVVSLVAASSARAATTDPRETAHVLADGVRVTATPGTSTLCLGPPGTKVACRVTDFIYPLTLHGRAPAGAGRTVLVLLAAPARYLRASLGDVRSRPVAASLRVHRVNPRRWRVRLPARLPAGLDRLSIFADYDASNEVNFEAGLRVVRRAEDPHTPFRFTLTGRVLLVDLKPGSDQSPPDRRLAGVQGRRVVTACGTSLRERHGTTTVRRTPWPRHARSLHVRLPRDVSAAARFCVLEEPDGTDIAAVRF